MTRQQPSKTGRPGRRRRSAEFMTYFALLFILAIPFVTTHWIIDIFRAGTLDLPGPISRAWIEAHRVTPLIFSA